MTQPTSAGTPEAPAPHPSFAYDGIDQKEGLFQNYSEYSKSLRTWFVAYGIGGPVLFLSNEKLSTQLTGKDEAAYIVSAFLLGVALQIGLSMINKWVAWHMYVGAGDEEYQEGWQYRTWSAIARQIWLDILLDAISIFLFIYATWKTMTTFLSPSITGI
ncbi:TPA: hypothetical protein ACGCF6_001668 [Stenotrophomonas maltophilia]